MMQGQVADAIGELRECLRLNPEYLNAHYNLAKALAANDDLNAAAKEYSIVLEKQPEDGEGSSRAGHNRIQTAEISGGAGAFP